MTVAAFVSLISVLTLTNSLTSTSLSRIQALPGKILVNSQAFAEESKFRRRDLGEDDLRLTQVFSIPDLPELESIGQDSGTGTGDDSSSGSNASADSNRDRGDRSGGANNRRRPRRGDHDDDDDDHKRGDSDDDD